MRMRKKKNLDVRMDACNSLFERREAGCWRRDRGEDTPLYLEIGCGKGRFAVESAKQMPECEYVAVERETNVIVMAAEKAQKAELTNIHFLSVDATTLKDVFAQGEVDRIYLNFSDPWPPKKHWKRRLTHRRVLKQYDGILKIGGELFFKTDNEGLFEFTMEELPQCGYDIRWFTHDLHAENIPNIMTEYEENFSAKGFKIHRLEAVKVREVSFKDEEEVSLEEMLEARERRAEYQNRLLSGYGLPLVSLGVNMPGPVKLCEDSITVFNAACDAVREALAGNIIYNKQFKRKTGCEGYFVTDLPALEIKRLLCDIEENHPLGRLFDADVLTLSGEQISRVQLGYSARSCIVCGKEGKECARSRAHSIDELTDAFSKIVEEYKTEKTAHTVSEIAYNALVEEVCITPKPGLVDKNNNGAHKDMNIGLFIKSADAVKPYFYQMAQYAQKGVSSGIDIMPGLRDIGKKAEKAMLSATGGVNTHKGAIFSLGLLCAAAAAFEFADINTLCANAASLVKGICSAELGAGDTNGQKAYSISGARGARGEAESGFESVRKYGLPVFEANIDNGQNHAGVKTLVSLMANVRDTNVLTRGGKSGEQLVLDESQKLLADFSIEKANALDSLLISKNISPGGCADLLAVTLFLYNLQRKMTK